LDIINYSIIFCKITGKSGCRGNVTMLRRGNLEMLYLNNGLDNNIETYMFQSVFISALVSVYQRLI